ncbi:MAG: hypothetical protein IT434_11470 [Phycisphaerales bacterium]|jgi:hypothetical protein|nr:hypothetical protein [Phycisphaerales bacterium]
MNRAQLEHVVRAAAAITGADQFVIIGSNAILGELPSPPPELTTSMDADIYSLRSPDDTNLIDGSIGELSPFHATFGYYAHGVSRETATLPKGWELRLVKFVPPSGTPVAWCLELHDLAVSKLCAGRPKDSDYIRAMIAHQLADPAIIRARLDETPLDDPSRRACLDRLARILA